MSVGRRGGGQRLVPKSVHMKQTPITPELMRAALAHIPPNLPRDEWARVAMAIKSEYPDDTGWELFEAWSETAGNHDAHAARSTWRSVKAGGGVTASTLIYLAKQHGFELPKAGQAATGPSPAELARREAERQQAAQHEAQERQAAHAAAAQAARTLWDAASPTGASAYLDRKGVQAHGLRFDASTDDGQGNGSLLVPMRDATGELWNVQRITPAGDKRFSKGGRKSGLWHMLGSAKGAPVVLLGEGYATCASVHEAGGWPVAVAFDAGNLLHVARELRRLLPDALLVVCGDDDQATQARTGTNPGRVKATAAAGAVGGLAVFPTGLQGGSDFNDLHQAQGLPAVRAAIDAAMLAHQAGDSAAPAAQAADKPPSAPAKAPAPPVAKPGKRAKAPAEWPDASEGPADAFSVDDGGVYFHGRDKDGNPSAPLRLCSRLDVEALTHDQDGQGWGYLLQFTDRRGRPKQWAMPARMLAGDGGEYRAMLLNMGLYIAPSPSARQRLTEYIQTRQPEAFATCTDRIGWHPTAGGAAYVLPHCTIGDEAERIVFQSDTPMENTCRTRKDAAAWRDRIGALCAGNSRLVFAVACAFAGPLLRLAGMESGGFHLRGDSSSGKTTALRVAASVNGGPSYMQRWRTTDNALEAIAAQHCDALLILDELAQVDGKVAGECAYMLANEQSKARATRGGAPRARLSWRLLFLSAGELGLADHMAEGMKRARTGQEVRMADIPADAGAGLGAFECIHGSPGPAEFASHLAREVQTCHGAPGLAFIEWACTRWGELARPLRDNVATLTGQWSPAGASGQVQRVAARFALVAAAGELATDAGLTGWASGEAERGVRACFDAWLAARGGAGNGEVVAMLRQVRRFLETHGEGRFTWWHRGADDHNAKTLQRAGFRRMLNAEGQPIKHDNQHMQEYGDRMPSAAGEGVSVEFFVLPEVFRSEMCQGFAHEAVCRVLADHGCLATEDGRHTVQARLPGLGKTRCYRIPPAIFALDL